MQPKSVTAKPLAEVISAIRALDLESVTRQLTDPIVGKGWTREHADSVEVGYRNFLMMIAEHQERAEDIKLSKDVDDFWHTHILQTRKYALDCETVFGAFLHHNPEISVSAEQQAAYCTAAVDAKAYCTAAVDAKAYCTAAVEAKAYCTAAVEAKAYCTAAVEAKAYCTAAVEPKQQAYCTAAIEAKAYCTAAIAYCTAAIETQQAYCTAALDAQQAAYCTASISAR